MGADAPDWERALARLHAVLGAERILSGARAAEVLRARSLNPAGDPAPRYLLQPRTTEECRLAIEALAAVGGRADPVAALTTFWEPYPGDVAVGIDTLALRAPCRVDERERVGYFGAGITIREADRLARARGLCLLAYPDSDGGSSLGSLAAIGCTTGLGMGRLQPLDQVLGLTVVSRAGTVLRTGASWRLGHGGVAHGVPDATGVFLASQGELGVITEVLLALAPAPFLAARWWPAPCSRGAELVDQLRRARRQLDQGVVDSLRLETVAAGREPPRASEWFLRCWAPDSPAAADDRCAAAARALGAPATARVWLESAAARAGEPPDDDLRYSLPPGSHQARTGTAGFLGLEVTVNWGDQLEPALGLLSDVFAALADLEPGHRRLGIYPGPHAVAIGVQAMLTGGKTTTDAVRETMATAVEPLNALGAVPYRPGRLWRDVRDRRERDDPCAVLVRRAALSA